MAQLVGGSVAPLALCFGSPASFSLVGIRGWVDRALRPQWGERFCQVYGVRPPFYLEPPVLRSCYSLYYTTRGSPPFVMLSAFLHPAVFRGL